MANCTSDRGLIFRIHKESKTKTKQTKNQLVKKKIGLRHEQRALKRSQRNGEFVMRLCQLQISEATSMKVYRHDCLNMSSTGTTDTLCGQEKAKEVSTLYKELLTTKDIPGRPYSL